MGVELKDFPGRPEIPAAEQGVDNHLGRIDGRCTAGEGLADQTGPWSVFLPNQRRADLAELSDCHHVYIGIQSEVLKSEELRHAAEGLNFIDQNGGARLFHDPHEGDEKFPLPRIKTTSPLHQLKNHSGVITGMSGEMAFEGRHGFRGALRRTAGIVEGDIIDVECGGKPLPICGIVRYPRQGQGAAHEAGFEGQETARGVVPLKDQLEGVFVGQGQGAAHEAGFEGQETARGVVPLKDQLEGVFVGHGPACG